MMNQAYRNAIAAAGAALITHVGLVDDDDQPVGDARKAVTWASPDDGLIRPSGNLVFTMAPGDKVEGWQGYSASSGGTAYGIVPLDPVEFGTGDTLSYTLLAAETQIEHTAA